MRFTFRDLIWSGSFVALITIVCSSLSRFIYSHHYLTEGMNGLAAIMVFLCTWYLLWTIIFLITARIFPLKEGLIDLGDDNFDSASWKFFGFINTITLIPLAYSPVFPPALRWLLYRLAGARIGSRCMIGGKIVEPLMVHIGQDVILGENCLVLGHLIQNKLVTLGAVRIEDGATIGAGSIILPGVTIGKSATVGAGAVVTKGTHVPGGETWVGSPARPIAVRGSMSKARPVEE